MRDRIKGFKNFIVKRIPTKDMDDKGKKLLQKIIKTKNPDFIEFYDIWEDKDSVYIAMQKLSDNELNGLNKDYKEANKILFKNFPKITDDETGKLRKRENYEDIYFMIANYYEETKK
jgi:hypothetical protein